MENLKSKIQFLVNLYKSKNLNKAEIYAKKIIRENSKVVLPLFGLLLAQRFPLINRPPAFKSRSRNNP